MQITLNLNEAKIVDYIDTVLYEALQHIEENIKDFTIVDDLANKSNVSSNHLWLNLDTSVLFTTIKDKLNGLTTREKQTESTQHQEQEIIVSLPTEKQLADYFAINHLYKEFKTSSAVGLPNVVSETNAADATKNIKICVASNEGLCHIPVVLKLANLYPNSSNLKYVIADVVAKDTNEFCKNIALIKVINPDYPNLKDFETIVCWAFHNVDNGLLVRANDLDSVFHIAGINTELYIVNHTEKFSVDQYFDNSVTGVK